MNTDFTPSSNYAVNEAKNSALMAEYGRKSEAQKRLSGRMQDVQTAIQNHDIMNQGVVDLMEVNPELYKSMSEAVKARDSVAKDQASKKADFMAGAVPYVAHAEERGQTKQQAWDDYKGFAQQSGVPLGQFAEMPYSDNALAMLKSSIYGIKGVLEGGASLQEENGALVTRTPLGDVKDVKVLPQEKAEKPKTLVKVETARGTEFVTPKEGMVLPPPPEQAATMTPYQQWQVSESGEKSEQGKAQAYKAVDSLDATLMAYKEELASASRADLANPLSDKAQKLGSLATQLQMAYKTAAELGAITGPDWAIVNRIISTPSSMLAIVKGPDMLRAQLEEVGKLSKRDRAILDAKYGKANKPANNAYQEYVDAFNRAKTPEQRRAITERARKMGVVK